jgi:hypothetical protein
MGSTKKRLTFVEVRKLANAEGLSMDRHPIRGFRIWNNGFPAEKYKEENLHLTLNAAQQFIETYKSSTTS